MNNVLPPRNPIYDEFVASVLQMFGGLEEYEAFQQARQDINDIDGMTEVISNVEVLDKDLVNEIESRFPGIIRDNVAFEDRYTPTGLTITLESLDNIKRGAMANSSRATLAMLDKFSDFLRTLKKKNLSEGLSAVLDSIAKVSQGIKFTTKEDKVLMSAYKGLMGVPPDSPEQVKEMIAKFPDYKNPIQCLKDYPNESYNRIFTPLLAATIADSSAIFSLFDKLNNEYAAKLINNVAEAHEVLNDIMEKKDYGRLARFNKHLIPDDLMKALSEMVAALNVQLDHRKPLLQQTRTISKQMTLALKPNEKSLGRKASVVNAITNRHKEIDKAFNDILTATDKMSGFGKSKDQDMQTLRNNLKDFRWQKPISEVIKGSVDGTGSQAVKVYNRILDEMTGLWNLVSLLVRTSVVYVTSYSITKISIDTFNTNLITFGKKVASDSQKPTEPQQDTEEVMVEQNKE